MRKKKGYTMANEIYRRMAGSWLTPEEMTMLVAAEKFPPAYDNDCPKMTSEQLAQFKPGLWKATGFRGNRAHFY
jgi:hypothetical protein